MQARAHKVVSSESEELILVDENDRETGTLSKARCHDGGGVLHRAFSVFLFDADGQLLLQQRAPGKRLWPGYWSNSCCSHPRKGEDMALATARRLEQELGVQATSLEFVYKFSYQAQYGELGAEHELCWVYLGKLAGSPQPNATEIADVRFVSAAVLDGQLASDTDAFTPWFQMEWQRLRNDFPDTLARYTGGAS